MTFTMNADTKERRRSVSPVSWMVVKTRAAVPRTLRVLVMTESCPVVLLRKVVPIWEIWGGREEGSGKEGSGEEGLGEAWREGEDYSIINFWLILCASQHCPLSFPV